MKFKKKSSPFFLFLAWRPSWLEVSFIGHNFGRGSPKDHSTKVWLQLVQWFLKKRFLCEFPIGSYVKLSSAVWAILVEGMNRQTHFWKRTIQWLFHQNLVLIEQQRTLWEIQIKIFSSETTGPIATNLWWNGIWMTPFLHCVRWSRLPTKISTKLKIEKWEMKFKKKIFSETTEPISTKLCWNGPWGWLFHQNLVLIEQIVSDKKIFMGISLRGLCKINFGCGSHLGQRSEMPNTFWKGTTQGPFQQSLVEIGSVVSEKKIFFLNFIPHFSIFSSVDILVGSRDHRTQCRKEVIQIPFQVWNYLFHKN
jgi:hypothetical protein